MLLCFALRAADDSPAHLLFAHVVCRLSGTMQYAALASKVTMTSEVEHDIAGEAWPSASNIPAGSATQAAATAGAAAAAAAASAALSAAQARIEELLDDKADLEYEIDVVERKVELLREEVSLHEAFHSFIWHC